MELVRPGKAPAPAVGAVLAVVASGRVRRQELAEGKAEVVALRQGAGQAVAACAVAGARPLNSKRK